jgi:hypothetical protein
MTGFVVEMIGLCGAGKTTLAEKLLPLIANSQEADAFDVVSRPAPSGYHALFAAGRLMLAASRHSPQTARFLLHGEGRGLALKLGYRLAGLSVRRLPRPTLVTESGILQPIISFEAQINHDGIYMPLEPFLTALPLPNAVIRVDAPAETAFARYKARQFKDGQPADGSIETFRRAVSALNAVCNYLTRHGGEVLQFSSIAPMDMQSVGDLARELRERALSRHRTVSA